VAHDPPKQAFGFKPGRRSEMHALLAIDLAKSNAPAMRR
jgi:hypothetical protein